MLERSPFGIPELDALLGGGYISGSANIVEGAPGTGKTTLGMQYIVQGIEKYREPGLILTFEEFPSQYYHDALGFGWDLRKYEEAGLLKIIFTQPQDAFQEIDEMGGKIETLIDEMGIKRCLIDSLTHFEAETSDPHELRHIEYQFLTSLKREGLTSILLRENDNLLGQTSSLSQAPFLSDSYTMLRYVEIDSVISKAMVVLKMRGSQHIKDIREFSITSKGIVLSEKFSGQDGILSGTPMRAETSAFMSAFVRKGKGS